MAGGIIGAPRRVNYGACEAVISFDMTCER
jgi:hypothetical protein